MCFTRASFKVVLLRSGSPYKWLQIPAFWHSVKNAFLLVLLVENHLKNASSYRPSCIELCWLAL